MLKPEMHSMIGKSDPNKAVELIHGIITKVFWSLGSGRIYQLLLYLPDLHANRFGDDGRLSAWPEQTLNSAETCDSRRIASRGGIRFMVISELLRCSIEETYGLTKILSIDCAIQ